MSKQPTALIIFDGLGLSDTLDGNAFKTAQTPVLDGLLKEWPWSHLDASHHYVGLPDGQMGNSEVGHLNIGAGRVVFQELLRVTNSLKDGEFEKKKAFLDFLAGSENIHLMGLVSDGGVHSHIDHLKGIIEALLRNKAEGQVNIHCFLDGRDTPPQSARGYLRELQDFIDSLNRKAGSERIFIRSIIGRMYGMDRDTNWDRTRKAYDLLTAGTGELHTTADEAIAASYAAGINDEFVEPMAIRSEEEALEEGCVKAADGVFFFNFRADRARQITRAFTEGNEWPAFERREAPRQFLCLTEYHEEFNLPVVFEKESLSALLGEVVAEAGLQQLRIAETEKYAHVTFFFNGGTDKPFRGEERILVPSPKVRTYDLKPEMSAVEVTDALLEALDKDTFDFIVLNFANPDMVGHTGVLKASVKALETIDRCMGRILEKLESLDGRAFMTADHGNCEKMVAEDNSPHTAHTTNQVFLIAWGRGMKEAKLKDGKLADIAPTLLHSMGLPIPAEMTGEVLLKQPAPV